jgi:dTDP-4-amino-4,6-dideoxygalactose transaminase
MRVEPLATDPAGYARPYLPFPNARSAFRALLDSSQATKASTVVLPAFIGWSPREGSGVFDPVADLGRPYAFYRVDDRLHIDLSHLEEVVEAHRPVVLVLIHFFGYPDPLYQEAVEIGKRCGALVVEDEAHAMFTDLVGGVSGRLGHSSIFSLHKMLPMPTGGMLLINAPGSFPIPEIADGTPTDKVPWDFDLHGIASKRLANNRLLSDLVRSFADEVELLWPDPNPGVIPQTLPVLIKRANRDALYQRMRDCGVGVVTLYHTLIDPIGAADFPASHRLRSRIMNLPVHQDLDPGQIHYVAECLDREIRSLVGAQQ